MISTLGPLRLFLSVRTVQRISTKRFLSRQVGRNHGFGALGLNSGLVAGMEALEMPTPTAVQVAFEVA